MTRESRAEHRLNAFLNELDARRVPYRVTKVRPESIMVEVVAPGQRWEIEFLDDGHLAIERFRSDGTIEDESALRDLWSLVDDSVPTQTLRH